MSDEGMAKAKDSNILKLAEALGKHIAEVQNNGGNYCTTPEPGRDFSAGLGEDIPNTLGMAFDGNLDLVALAQAALDAVNNHNK